MDAIRTVLPLLALLAPLGGCTDGKDADAPEVPSTSSGQALVARDGSALYAPLVDDGVVARMDLATGAVERVDVGEEPTRLTRVGDRVLVTLRNERAIAVLRETPDGLEPVGQVATGTEPAGIVAHPDGSRVYVVLSTQEEIHELDAEDLSVLRRFPLTGQPEWIAIHPGGEALYVGTVVRGAYVFDLADESPVAAPIVLPDVAGGGDPFTRTVSGDLAVSPDGTRLAVPTLWQDILRPPRHTDEESMQRDPAERYAEIGLGLSPNNPGIVLVDLDARGMPTGATQSLYGVGEAVTLPDEAPRVVRGYFAAAAWSPDGETVLAAMEGSRVVVAMGTDPATFGEAPSTFVQPPAAFVGTGRMGVNGLAFAGEGEDLRALAVQWIDRSAVDLPWATLRAELAAQAGGATPTPLFVEAVPVTLGPPTLGAQVEEGRDLFHSAVSGVMSTGASGVSCATCHVNGRSSGVNVMERDLIPRQVPSFAGPIAMTAPFTWNNEVPTVPEEARITSQIRLGGRNVTDTQLEAVAAYIEFIRDVDHPEKGSTSAAVTRGRALFERRDVGCARCHAGERLTDNLAYDLYGMEGVNTPTLVGIVATAPYLHDGRAATLRDVLVTTRDRQMGDASSLSDSDLDDLEAYLRSL